MHLFRNGTSDSIILQGKFLLGHAFTWRVSTVGEGRLKISRHPDDVRLDFKLWPCYRNSPVLKHTFASHTLTPALPRRQPSAFVGLYLQISLCLEFNYFSFRLRTYYSVKQSHYKRWINNLNWNESIPLWDSRPAFILRKWETSSRYYPVRKQAQYFVHASFWIVTPYGLAGVSYSLNCDVCYFKNCLLHIRSVSDHCSEQILRQCNLQQERSFASVMITLRESSI